MFCESQASQEKSRRLTAQTNILKELETTITITVTDTKEKC